MNARRRYTGFFVALALSSLSCSVVPLARMPGPDAEPASLVFTPAEFSADALAAARVLGRLHTGLVSGEIARVAVAVAIESHRAGLPVELVLALLRVESSGNNFAVSNAGAMGLMQLRPSTAEAVASRIGLRWVGPATLFDPVSNVRLGVSYLRELVDRYGSVRTALAAYNWGPTRIAARIRRGETIPVIYANRVIEAFGGRESAIGAI